MPDYRRHRVPGETYFFTVNLLERRSRLLIEHVNIFRVAVLHVRANHLFHIDAWTLLPDFAAGPQIMAILAVFDQCFLRPARFLLEFV